jgi:glycosyltransferase involved in cell wall biosynthesis
MRYLRDGYEAYRQSMRGVIRLAFTATAGGVKRWDAAAARHVSYFPANSNYVAERIERCHGRKADVLPPPIDLHRAAGVADERPEEHYLCAGRLVSYKRTEILIEACQRMSRRLRIPGTGPEEPRLRELAEGDAQLCDTTLPGTIPRLCSKQGAGSAEVCVPVSEAAATVLH